MRAIDIIEKKKKNYALSKEEIEDLTKEGGESLNKAKEVLAYEVTKMVHGKAEADSALNAARALFSNGGDENSIPHTIMEKSIFENGINVVDLLFETKLAKSKSE
ncbi:hypothetical protein P7M40_24030, partial [Vibrio parahaemolyticus]|nr:hypothetical protein [Vibrio parahaemolyticus]